MKIGKLKTTSDAIFRIKGSRKNWILLGFWKDKAIIKHRIASKKAETRIVLKSQEIEILFTEK